MTKGCLTAVGAIWLAIFLFCGGLVVVGMFKPRLTPIEPTIKPQVSPEVAKKEEERKAWERAAKKRASELAKRGRELQREYDRFREDAEHTKRRVELGEISTEYGIVELQVIAKQAKRVDDERKRLESELYEIKRGTWKPKPSP